MRETEQWAAVLTRTRGAVPKRERRDEILQTWAETTFHCIPDAGIYRGHEGYARWLADWGEAWRDFGLEPERWVDASDKVVLVFRITAVGKGSGVEVKRRDAMVFTYRDGKTVRLDYYNNEPEALAAAGVKE